MEELKRIIDDSEITKEDDALWPPPDRVGRQVCTRFLYSFSVFTVRREENVICFGTGNVLENH